MFAIVFQCFSHFCQWRTILWQKHSERARSKCAWKMIERPGRPTPSPPHATPLRSYPAQPHILFNVSILVYFFPLFSFMPVPVSKRFDQRRWKANNLLTVNTVFFFVNSEIVCRKQKSFREKHSRQRGLCIVTKNYLVILWLTFKMFLASFPTGLWAYDRCHQLN